MTSPLSNTHCPRCHKENRCAMAQGLSIDHCWCMTSTTSTNTQSRHIRATVCYCGDCLQELKHQHGQS